MVDKNIYRPDFYFNNYIVRYLFLILSLFFSISHASEYEHDYPNVNIIAPSDLAVPLSKIARNYSATNNIDIGIVYESTDFMVDDVLSGEPIDIIITGNDKWIEQLRKDEMLNKFSISTILSNKLAIASSYKFKIDESDQQSLLDQIYKKVIMVIASPEATTQGDSTKHALTELNRWNKFQSHVTRAPDPVIALNMLRDGNTAGIIYLTDARLHKDKINTLKILPYEYNYKASIVVNSNILEATKFLDHLKTHEAQNIFASYGFNTLYLTNR